MQRTISSRACSGRHERPTLVRIEPIEFDRPDRQRVLDRFVDGAVGAGHGSSCPFSQRRRRPPPCYRVRGTPPRWSRTFLDSVDRSEVRRSRFRRDRGASSSHPGWRFRTVISSSIPLYVVDVTVPSSPVLLAAPVFFAAGGSREHADADHRTDSSHHVPFVERWSSHNFLPHPVGVELMTGAMTSINIAEAISKAGSRIGNNNVVKILISKAVEPGVGAAISRIIPNIEFFDSHDWGYSVVTFTTQDCTYRAYSVDKTENQRRQRKNSSLRSEFPTRKSKFRRHLKGIEVTLSESRRHGSVLL